MKKIIIMILLFLIPITIASTNNTCISNDTLRIEDKFNLTEDGDLTEFVITRNEYCRWGCDNVTHSCSPTEINKGLIVLFIVLGVGIVLFVLMPRIFGR